MKRIHTQTFIFIYRLNIYLALLALLTGGLIYILYRTIDPVFFRWIKVAGFENWLYSARHFSSAHNFHLPDWIVYSLPNGLWAFAFALLITGIWKGSDSVLKYIWMASIPLLVFGFEILQYLRLISGTFCLEDIALSAIGMIIGIYLGRTIIKPIYYEKGIK